MTTQVFTQADYEQALQDVEDQEQILKDASAAGGTAHVEKHHVVINIKRARLKKIRDAMVAAGTLPPSTPEVELIPIPSQLDDVWSKRRDD